MEKKSGLHFSFSYIGRTDGQTDKVFVEAAALVSREVCLFATIEVILTLFLHNVKCDVFSPSTTWL